MVPDLSDRGGENGLARRVCPLSCLTGQALVLLPSPHSVTVCHLNLSPRGAETGRY